jgi:hypothetical protein
MAMDHPLIPVERIEGAILLIRGQKVILDAFLAGLGNKGLEPGRETKYREIPKRLHVPTHRTGV